MTDQELAARACRGDGRATAELVVRAMPVVRGLGRRLTRSAEEGDALAQEAIVLALQQLERYRGEAAFATWVCSIVVRRHADHARRAGADERLRARLQPPAEPDPADVAEHHDTETRLWELVAKLPPGERDAVLANAASDSQAEAAQRLGVSLNVLRVRLHRARRALRELARAEYPDWEELGYAHG